MACMSGVSPETLPMEKHENTSGRENFSGETVTVPVCRAGVFGDSNDGRV
jgi:hypothetical protein